MALVSRNRWALMHELRGETEPSLDEILERLSPCDLVIIEGYKREDHPKIEMIRDTGEPRPATNPMLWQEDPSIVLIGSTENVDGCALPRLGPDQVAEIADFILAWLEKARSNAAE